MCALSHSYKGRFAPSPTGPLHFGSLLTALASFLQARHLRGVWLVRIEDVDTGRSVTGADNLILEALDRYGLSWDGTVAYQSERDDAYARALDTLLSEGLAFRCGCTRREVARGPQGVEGPIYTGTCRDGLLPGRAPRSVRARVGSACISFTDAIQGPQRQCLATDIGDFIIRRADGLYAYQLAVVVDDAWQGITEVVRGADLLASTPRQIWLQQQLGLPVPTYAHVPLAVDAEGRKLSKQTAAAALPKGDPRPVLLEALACLGQEPDPFLAEASRDEILDWAIEHWELAQVPAQRIVRQPSA